MSERKMGDLKKTGMTSGTDAAGGEHAHTGMMIYLETIGRPNTAATCSP